MLECSKLHVCVPFFVLTPQDVAVMTWAAEWEPGWSQRSQTVAVLVYAAIPCPSTNSACTDSIHPQMARAAPPWVGFCSCSSCHLDLLSAAEPPQSHPLWITGGDDCFCECLLLKLIFLGVPSDSTGAFFGWFSHQSRQAGSLPGP